MLYERTGKQAQARPMYERVLKLQPDQPVALNNLAYVMAESGGDLNQALTLAQRARQKMPDNADIADTLGWIYIKKNLSDNAIGIYRDLIVKRPESSTFRYHLAMALYQRGDKPQARKELQSALERKPSPQETVKIRELMGRIG
jgi:Flp pilus assembly protein TadD